MKAKIKIAILFGGKSAEHEVSILSARNVYQALDKNKYEVTLVGIDRDGRWYVNQNAKALLETTNPSLIKLNQSGPQVALTQVVQGAQLIPTQAGATQPIQVDVVFPVLHGPMGEDGTVQGMLKLMGIPFVGPSVLGSALGMDKDVMKRLLKEAQIPIANFVTIKHFDKTNVKFSEIERKLGLPMFIKPANMGSSVGVSKAKNESEFWSALEEAFKYDTKVIIEEAIIGREVECSVLGNENPKASLPGEVKASSDFYSYDAKYMDPNGAITLIPADLPQDIISRVQKMAIKTFQVLECEGMSRVDFFLKQNSDLIVNEINTIPGFTKISMYPKMWEVSGLGYSQLIDELIQLALNRFERDSQIKTTPELKGGSFNA